MHEPALNDEELLSLEREISELNDSVVHLAESRMERTKNSGKDKISLFRQQAVIIARKKEGTAQRYRALQEQISKLNSECESKRASKSTGTTRVLKGEEFKKYVAELRVKSTAYKKKKTDVSQLVAEYGILARTEEILKQREKAMKDSIGEMEKNRGALGTSDAVKTDSDQGKTLDDILETIQSITQTIKVCRARS